MNLRVSRRCLIVTVLALVAVAVAVWWRYEPHTPAGYVTARVERGRIEVIVSATGTVNPVKTVQVGTYVSGPIQKIYVDYNSRVSKGQLVAEIDPQPFRLRVQQAEANLANAKARVEKSRADLRLKELTLQRTRDLFKKALVSRSDLDQAESEAQQSEAQLRLDEAQVLASAAALEEARVNLGYASIVSPVDGVVIRRDVDVGQTVAASFQTPTLFLIAEDLTKMQVNANVSESDIGALREGQRARFTVDAFPELSFEGVVTQVRNAPLMVQNVVTYDVVVSVDNHELKLKPGMTATVSIVTDERDHVLTVPAAALRFRPPTEAATNGRVLWRWRDGRALERVPVQVGISDEEHTEVTGGALEEGDEVVLAIEGEAGAPEGPRVLGMPRFR